MSCVDKRALYLSFFFREPMEKLSPYPRRPAPTLSPTLPVRTSASTTICPNSTRSCRTWATRSTPTPPQMALLYKMADSTAVTTGLGGGAPPAIPGPQVRRAPSIGPLLTVCWTNSTLGKYQLSPPLFFWVEQPIKSVQTRISTQLRITQPLVVRGGTKRNLGSWGLTGDSCNFFVWYIWTTGLAG